MSANKSCYGVLAKDPIGRTLAKTCKQTKADWCFGKNLFLHVAHTHRPFLGKICSRIILDNPDSPCLGGRTCWGCTSWCRSPGKLLEEAGLLAGVVGLLAGVVGLLAGVVGLLLADVVRSMSECWMKASSTLPLFYMLQLNSKNPAHSCSIPLNFVHPCSILFSFAQFRSFLFNPV